MIINLYSGVYMRFSIALFLWLLTVFNAFAIEQIPEKEIRAHLAQLLPSITVDQIKVAPIEGFYEITIGTNIVYMTTDLKYIFQGDILNIKARKNLTEAVRSDARAKLLKRIDKADYIEFASNNEQHVIYVFTDIDCGYCRKLHRDVSELNDKGISVRYLAFPRAGLDSKTAKKMRDVWCADNPQQALTAAKNGQSVPVKSCQSPIAKEYELGQQLGIRGTPATFLQNGQQLSGYMPPDQLLDKIQP